MTATTRRGNLRLSRGIIPGCVVAAVSMICLAAPAHADGELGLSRDGVHWSDELTTPLFADDVLWVPGDVHSAHFFVRNQASELGRLSVAVQQAPGGTSRAADDLDIEIRAADGAWTPVEPGGVQPIAGADDLSTGRPTMVSVRARLDESSLNRTMTRASDLTFLVRLTDARAVEAATGSVDASQAAGDIAGQAGAVQSGLGDGSRLANGELPAGVSSDFLPATGNSVDQGVLWLGFVLVGSGTFLAVRRRQRDEVIDHG